VQDALRQDFKVELVGKIWAFSCERFSRLSINDWGFGSKTSPHPSYPSAANECVYRVAQKSKPLSRIIIKLY